MTIEDFTISVSTSENDVHQIIVTIDVAGDDRRLRAVSRTPETEEQLIELMKAVGRQIWRNHVRQMQKTIRQGASDGE